MARLKCWFRPPIRKSASRRLRFENGPGGTIFEAGPDPHLQRSSLYGRAGWGLSQMISGVRCALIASRRSRFSFRHCDEARDEWCSAKEIPVSD